MQIVRLMGHKIDKQADLELRDDAGNVVKLKDVAMTEAYLRRIGRSALRNETQSREDALHDLKAFQAAIKSRLLQIGPRPCRAMPVLPSMRGNQRTERYEAVFQ